MAYSWGFNFLVSAVHRMYGVPGIISLLIIFQVPISFVFLLAIRRSARNPWWSCLVAAVSIYAFYINPLRPALFTLLFFTIQLSIIFEAERREDDRLLFWMGRVHPVAIDPRADLYDASCLPSLSERRTPHRDGIKTPIWRAPTSSSFSGGVWVSVNRRVRRRRQPSTIGRFCRPRRSV